jgi:Photosynthesis system II assembly factor YCF48
MGKEGWIVGKPAILLYTSDAGASWERIPLSSQLPGDMVLIYSFKTNLQRSATFYQLWNSASVKAQISGGDEPQLNQWWILNQVTKTMSTERDLQGGHNVKWNQ